MSAVAMSADGNSGRLSVRVHSIGSEAEGVRSLRLVPVDGAPLPEWDAGAHIDLHLPSGLIRQYSLCGDIADSGSYRIAVLQEPAGRGGSLEVHAAISEGDTLTISRPRNHFALEPAGSYLFIAGGIGITPILPMVRQAAAGGVPWRLIYGGRTAATMAFIDELAGVAGGEVLLRPQDAYGLLNLEQIVGNASADAAIYTCGPPGLIDAVLDVAARLRPETEVRFERFSPVTVDASDDETFEVQLARSGRSVAVPVGISILQAVREVGIEVESSCEEGTCGTCEAKVLGGTPEHRDSILTAAERKANDVMMICVSRAASPLLVLDL